MADFILSDPIMFRGATVLELGAGTGLTSIILATIAKTVYCTGIMQSSSYPTQNIHWHLQVAVRRLNLSSSKGGTAEYLKVNSFSQIFTLTVLG